MPNCIIPGCQSRSDKSVECRFFFPLTVKDLSIRIPRGKAKLKPGKIPCIFPNQQWQYMFIAKNIHTITLPSPYSIVNVCPDFIVWNCWSENKNHDSIKRITLLPDMTFKVFVNNRCVNINFVPNNMQQLIEMLNTIDKVLSCDTTEANRIFQNVKELFLFISLRPTYLYRILHMG
ncbi:hypothetical protein PUN28_019725 [Cardiocondyla obscurior]|uniref:THAP-type domain-containing protein n=1 Tax=Cardiocondyla obscurior TaxID=286306 RepID=A0AAW2EFM2_9HYME